METLEPLLSVAREQLTTRGWSLSGVQKTTSYEYEGAWESASLRSAYAFFHDGEDPEGDGPALELFIDESEEGLEATLSLVADAPGLEKEPDTGALLGRAVRIAANALPVELPAPVALSYHHRGRASPESSQARVRFKSRIPVTAIRAGESAVRATLSTLEGAFREILLAWAHGPGRPG